jgi:hypothetical protein
VVRRSGPAAEPVRPVWDPAGPDRRLAAACEELRAGRTSLAAEVLADRRDGQDARSHRFLVLAQVAAGNGAAEIWAAEQPGSAEAALLLIRAAVIRALQADRERHPKAGAMIARARSECWDAARRMPADPLPWVALLQLAAIAPENVAGPAELGIPGPWGLMEQLWHRDMWNREAHHRLLAAVGPRAGGSVAAMSSVARWIADQAPPGSPLCLLQLSAFVEAFRQQAETGVSLILLTDRHWSTAYAQVATERCYHGWFATTPPNGRLLSDLHLLAHALWAATRRKLAADVFTAIGPYALTTPWSLHGDPAEVFLRARERCLTEP